MVYFCSIKQVVKVEKSKSNKMKNPCPSGQRMENTDVNGTMFVICTDKQDIVWSRQQILGMSLGFGIGIPIIILVIYLVYRCKKTMKEKRAIIPSNVEETFETEKNVRGYSNV